MHKSFLCLVEIVLGSAHSPSDTDFVQLFIDNFHKYEALYQRYCNFGLWKCYWEFELQVGRPRPRSPRVSFLDLTPINFDFIDHLENYLSVT